MAQRGVYDAGGGSGAEAAPEAAILVRFSAAEESVGAISQRASPGFFRKGDVAVCVLMETSSGEGWGAVRLIQTWPESVSLRRMLDTLDASLTHCCNVSDEFLTNVYRWHGSFVNMPGVQIFRSSCKILVDLGVLASQTLQANR